MALGLAYKWLGGLKFVGTFIITKTFILSIFYPGYLFSRKHFSLLAWLGLSTNLGNSFVVQGGFYSKNPLFPWTIELPQQGGIGLTTDSHVLPTVPIVLRNGTLAKTILAKSILEYILISKPKLLFVGNGVHFSDWNIPFLYT